MSQKRLETKVGVFVAIGLVVLAVLIVLFSKGFSFNWQNYRVYLRTSNVGGRRRAPPCSCRVLKLARFQPSNWPKTAAP